MKQQIITFIGFLVMMAWTGGCALAQAPKREVRAVWLTTIGGLDWPRNKAYDAESIHRQQAELIDILDRLAAARFNTVLLQTRIRSTVIYPSAIEPWDDCLTGHAGQNPGYDPLKFAIEECHKRKMELHAWVVAFPGNSFRTASALGRQALQRRVPGLALKTNSFWMLNPGEPATADYIAGICREIVKNYDVDGINLDYIRYPEKEVTFNDRRTYRKYARGMNLADWRRDNVTRVVERIHREVKALKPWVRLSCSPIGKYDDVSRFSSRGWNALHTTSQDAQGWLRMGIMDMLVPMMYFDGDDFYPFVMDWMEQSCGRVIVTGLAAYMLDGKGRDWPVDVLERENNVVRRMSVGGQAYFRSRFVTDNTKGIYDFLKDQFYTYPALTPALTWESHEEPQQPQQAAMKQTREGLLLSWARQAGVTYNVYRSGIFPVDVGRPENMQACKLTGNEFQVDCLLPEGLLPYFAVTAMDRYGNESRPVFFNRPAKKKETSCTGLLRLEGHRLLLPSKNKETSFLVSDASERIVKSVPYDTVWNIDDMKPGLYVVRSMEKKKRTHYLGRLMIALP